MSPKTEKHSGAHIEVNLTLTIANLLVYADWCKQTAPIYEQLSTQLSRPQKLAFAKVNVDHQKEIAQSYGVTAQVTHMPTFVVIKNKQVVDTWRGAKMQRLQDTLRKLANEADMDIDGDSSAGGFQAPSASGSTWRGAVLPQAYGDITDQVDIRGLDLLNADGAFGSARTLFNANKPSTLDNGKGKSKEGGEKKDWVESDTDEQLMLYIPFQATLKIHSLQITSLPPASEGDEVPMRPKTIQLYTNRSHVLGFEEADDIPVTQSVTLNPSDWDEKTGTAKVELRFVKFQNITSLVIFVVDGEGSGEKVRVDRVRIIGETGEKRTLGKLEKIGDDP
ncbi:MAG: hypothetical protein MMC33_000466 [Icmadophila ericetorum]|nr:hypothetical protein [Icmadophila ericetorum]